MPCKLNYWLVWLEAGQPSRILLLQRNGLSQDQPILPSSRVRHLSVRVFSALKDHLLLDQPNELKDRSLFEAAQRDPTDLL